MNRSIKNIKPLGFAWETLDPFLFCVHHLDNYPPGNDEMGPAASLAGRNLGQDFTLKDGWRMYHGERIPGFPAHPHRGFETVTVVLKGLIDHSDSHGAAGRYGNGDVQWMTAGEGLQHSEMFPLLNKKEGNPLELFQIWLNLPKAKKLCKPHFAMLWAEDIPVHSSLDTNGKLTEITVIAGRYGNTSAPAPAPNSWAADATNEVAIWIMKLEANAQFVVPAASAGINRALYFYKGLEIVVDDIPVKPYHAIELSENETVILNGGNDVAYLLFLQGQPIKEPIVQHGPFVMNSNAEIQAAFSDFRKTQFGGWPWHAYDNVHPAEKGRFAKYANGREEVK